MRHTINPKKNNNTHTHTHTKETTTIKMFVSFVPKLVISFVQTRNQLGLIKLQTISTHKSVLLVVDAVQRICRYFIPPSILHAHYNSQFKQFFMICQFSGIFFFSFFQVNSKKKKRLSRKPNKSKLLLYYRRFFFWWIKTIAIELSSLSNLNHI